MDFKRNTENLIASTAARFAASAEMERRLELPAFAAKAGSVVCAIDAIADGHARVLALGDWREGLEIIVARQAGAVYGYVNVCAHMSLPLNIDSRLRTHDGLLMCDHHDARFRFADGVCVAGVCQGKALVCVPLSVRDGAVIIL